MSQSDSDSDAPEAVALSQSARTARGQARDVETFRAAEREKARAQNRARDARLKVQAGKGREKAQAGEEEERRRLEARMQRAMGDAEGESGGSEVDGEFDMGEGEEGEEDGEDDSEDEAMDEEESELDTEDEAMLMAGHYERDEDEDADEEEAENDDAEALPDPKSKYLPDHLFAAALRKKKLSTSPLTKTPPSAAPKRRKRVQKTAKDIVIGSRIIRALPRIDGLDTLSAPGTATPPARINRFLARALTKKGANKKGAGWERRPANVGVLRRTAGAPAAGFVRQR